MAKRLKGKEWYTLIAPKMFDEKVLGETLVGDPKDLTGRVVESSLGTLINDLSKYYFKLYFRVKNLEEKKAHTEFAGLECLRDYISRMIRHGIDRIDTIQDLETKDKKKLRVKTITVVNRRVRKGIEKSLRKFLEDRVKKEVESAELNEFLVKIIDDSLKRNVLNEGSKIYPLRMFEIRKIEILSK